jgi:putative phosphoesterase
MKVAIISDVHDNVAFLKKALECCQSADILVCCGDLCSPFVAKELALGFGRPIHIVFGNNDGDRFRIAANLAQYPQLHFHGEYVEIELGGRMFSVNHFDNIGRAIAASERFDVVCFGHTHRFEITHVGRTLVINPGEIYGELTGSATFVIYDTSSGEAVRVDVL